ncbi:unnamed protein product [Euphydryas editha]|uniref:Uncharacterized protein n=1 Tax=Euphydryas editha TaxID=104508 RepID=A0AAU9V4Y1_EUPED|nr:unnamed protein product [Euphydryas editha]
MSDSEDEDQKKIVKYADDSSGSSYEDEDVSEQKQDEIGYKSTFKCVIIYCLNVYSYTLSHQLRNTIDPAEKNQQQTQYLPF